MIGRPVLRGERVVLEPSTAEHRGDLVAIRTSPAVAKWWDPPGPRWPADHSDVNGYTVLLHHQIIGFVQWYESDDRDHWHAGIDIFLRSDSHGRGLGRETVTAVVNHLVEAVGHHRIVIDPAAANAAAIACYRACGFREVGLMRWYERHVQTGTWRDGLLMEYVVDPNHGRPSTARP
jgi:aminoglycoside 6'-N-acetyltransferase